MRIAFLERHSVRNSISVIADILDRGILHAECFFAMARCSFWLLAPFFSLAVAVISPWQCAHAREAEFLLPVSWPEPLLPYLPDTYHWLDNRGDEIARGTVGPDGSVDVALLKDRKVYLLKRGLLTYGVNVHEDCDTSAGGIAARCVTVGGNPTGSFRSLLEIVSILWSLGISTEHMASDMQTLFDYSAEDVQAALKRHQQLAGWTGLSTEQAAAIVSDELLRQASNYEAESRVWPLVSFECRRLPPDFFTVSRVDDRILNTFLFTGNEAAFGSILDALRNQDGTISWRTASSLSLIALELGDFDAAQKIIAWLLENDVPSADNRLADVYGRIQYRVMGHQDSEFIAYLRLQSAQKGDPVAQNTLSGNSDIILREARNALNDCAISQRPELIMR